MGVGISLPVLILHLDNSETFFILEVASRYIIKLEFCYILIVIDSITVSDIFITVTVIRRQVLCGTMRKVVRLPEVTFFILLSLYTPKHGYAVMQFIEDSTKGGYAGAGTLYGALNSLQGKRLDYLLEIIAGRKRIS